MTRFGPWKISKCLENGPLWDPKWIKKGSTTRFFKSGPIPLGVHKQVKLAHFEHVLTGACAPSCEVPSQISTVWGQKQPFLAQNSPETQSKRPNEGKQSENFRCASIAP